MCIPVREQATAVLTPHLDRVLFTSAIHHIAVTELCDLGYLSSL